MNGDKLKIVIVGGGGVHLALSLVRDMLLTPSLADAEYILLDSDIKLSDLTKVFLEKLGAKLGVGARFVSTTRREDMADAGYVVIAISTGGLDAMSYDLAIPEEFGIYHTVGDTSGPGGWARLIRNFNIFESLAHDINRFAPEALVLNYTNPMTTLTDVLNRICKGPVIGLCNSLHENLKFIKDLYGLNSEKEIAIRYAGINHFIWATHVRAGEIDVLADLASRLQQQSFTELTLGMGGGYSSRHEVATELFRTTGYLPYLGDRHTCEFFACYITNPANMKRYQLKRTTIEERRGNVARRRDRFIANTEGEIAPGYLHRSAETAADVIEAHSQGNVFIDVGNVPNAGQVSNLPSQMIVETAVRIDRNGITPLTFGVLPRIIQGFIEPYAHVFPMVVDACFTKNKTMALQALRLDPVCSHLNGDQVRDLGERLLAAHRFFMPNFS